MIQSHADIIDLWPSIAKFADDIGCKYVTAQVARHRKSIAPRRWPAVVAAAHQRGFEQVTIDLLSSLATPRCRDLPTDGDASRAA